MATISGLIILFGALAGFVFLGIWGMTVFGWYKKYRHLDTSRVPNALRQQIIQFKILLFVLLLGPLTFLLHTRLITALLVFAAFGIFIYLKRSYEPGLSAKLAPYHKT